MIFRLDLRQNNKVALFSKVVWSRRILFYLDKYNSSQCYFALLIVSSSSLRSHYNKILFNFFSIVERYKHKFGYFPLNFASYTLVLILYYQSICFAYRVSAYIYISIYLSVWVKTKTLTARWPKKKNNFKIPPEGGRCYDLFYTDVPNRVYHCPLPTKIDIIENWKKRMKAL